MNALVVFENGRWLRIAGARVAARGEAIDEAFPLHDEELVVGVIPGREVTVRSVALPDLAEAQARVAGRMSVDETSIAAVGTLHTATGLPYADGMRDVVAIEAARVTEHLVELARHGLDPDHLLAAPLMLPRPEIGFVSGDLGDGMVVRGSDTAFADHPELTPLLTAHQLPLALDRDALEDAVVAAVALPSPDLRSGIFAKRRRWAIDVARLRRLARLALAFGLLVLATQLVAVLRLNARAAALEADNRIQAAAILPPGTVVSDPALQAEARLAAGLGADGGLRPLASAIAAAVNAVPNAELGNMVFDGLGGLHVTVRGTTTADLDSVDARLATAGVQRVDGVTVANQGKPSRDIVVRAR